MGSIIIFAGWFGFFWSCFRVAAAIAVGVAVGLAVAAIAFAAGLAPIAGVALGLAAAAVAGAATYYFIGPYPEPTPPPPPPPPIEIISREIIIPIRFIPNDNPENDRSPTIHFNCELQKDETWIKIAPPTNLSDQIRQKDMLDQIRAQFLEIEKKRASDSQVVNNKKTKTSFKIDVYKKPFPGDTILSELKKLTLECFTNAQYEHNTYDEEYLEPEKKGDYKK